MSEWIDGNIPENTNLLYWITVKNTIKNETYNYPCRYYTDKECWVDFEGVKISSYDVVAYYPIIKPKQYSTIGTGVGYYIRTIFDKKETIYGRGLQLVSYGYKGYGSIDKAIIAARRMRKIDIDEGCLKDKYDILDGNGKLVKSLNNNKIK